jgi:flagellin-like protein
MRRAEMGIGVLIVLIAMIIVAAVAAGVLIGTSGILSQDAIMTGQAARKKVTNHMSIDLIRGLSDENRMIKTLFMRVSLTPGSDPALLNTTSVTDLSDGGSGTYDYLPRAECKYDAINGFYNFDSEALPATEKPFEYTRSNRFDFSDTQTSEFMVGKIAVGIVFVESNGRIQPSSEDWTRDRQDRVIEAVTNSLNWWREREPRAGIEFAYKIFRNAPSSYEPINNAAAVQDVWMPEVLDYIGAPSGASVRTRARSFDNALRDEYNAHWGILLVVIDSANDVDDAFPGSVESGFAYLNGPYAIITSETMGSQDFLEPYLAHEFGHLFGAADQYPLSDCNCSDRSGYLQVLNSNCNNPSQGNCYINESSIMRDAPSALDAYTDGNVDYYARAQMGIIDTNGNNIMDPVEVHFLEGDSGITGDRAIDDAARSFREYAEGETKEGFFAIERLNVENDQRFDVLQPGESAKICYKPAAPLEAYCRYMVNVLPIAGQMTSAEVKCSNVIAKDEQVIIYEAFK